MENPKSVGLDHHYVRDPDSGRAAGHVLRIKQQVEAMDATMDTTEARARELLAFHADRESWVVYRTICRLRFGYLSFLILMITLAFSFTVLMEIFFVVFLPSARTFSPMYIVRSLLLLLFLPVIVFVLSYFFEESWRFLIDAVDKTDGGLPKFRLALAVVIHYVRHRSSFKGELNVSRDAPASEGPRSTLRFSLPVIRSAEDPYADDEDTDEDASHVELSPHSAEKLPECSHESLARRRWKRAIATVISTNALKKRDFDGPLVGLSTFVAVDLVCPVLFEVVTIVMLVFNFLAFWSPYEAFLSYVRSGFWLMFVYLLVWIVCHFWSSRNPHMRRLVSHYRRNRRNMKRQMRSTVRERQAQNLWLLDVGFRFYHHIAVSRLHVASTRQPREADVDRITIDVSVDPAPASSATTGTSRLQKIRGGFASLREKNPWRRLSLNHQARILVVGCVLASLVAFWSFLAGWPLLGLCLVLLSRVIQRRFPQLVGSMFRHFVTVFVVFSLVFFSSTWIVGTFVRGDSFKLGEPTYNTFAAARTPLIHRSGVKTFSIDYPVCSLDYDGLTVLDLALIADASYSTPSTAQARTMRNRFAGTALANFTMVNHSSELEHHVWMEVFFPTLNVTVVSIRGTATAADALEDMHFWFGISLLQGVNMLVPFLNGLPRDFIVSLLSMNAISWFMPEPVFQPLVDHVATVKARVGGQLIVTGHSLGGAMAAVVGARVKARAVSLSGPGLLFSRGRFDVNTQDVRDFVLTLKPHKDIVPQVDKLGGMVQELRCREPSPMRCHSTRTHLCELYLSCGDSRQRNWAANAECLRYMELPPDGASE